MRRVFQQPASATLRSVCLHISNVFLTTADSPNGSTALAPPFGHPDRTTRFFNTNKTEVWKCE
ncbi:hypothetical protein BN2476_10029 [Paraburkholderia piptadeniae]|uniref:Uncharacterized protein n=1 Tax=Paraburkholderia piptadeniae TaxID=1701573 RepID=A0A1N7RIN0_9BURK|nr:hypothetical protein BN2476_10029 [Paraburkholderia piptadeniae]